MINLGVSSVLATGIADAVLNVLAIIGIVCLGAFIIVFICDLILSISGNKNGIFFKKKETIYEKEHERENEKDYNKEEENSFYDERISALEAKQNAIDEEKALQEEKELREKLALNRQEEVDNQANKEQEQDERIADLETKNAELLKLLEEKDETVDAGNENEEDKSNFLEDAMDEEDDYDDIIAAINKMREEEEKASQNNIVIDENEIEEETSIEDKNDENESLDVQASEDSIVQPSVEETVTASEVKDDEYYKTLSNEIEELKKELEEQKRIMESDKVEAQEREEALRKENAQLAEELEDAKQIQETTENEVTPIMLTEQEYNDRLEVLKERLKENEKQLRKIKKEYKPLERVAKTLERDREKLRRREAIVAKQKIVLYGVNNYIDIDEEKAQKLAEDLDLLDGLRLSVQHCEEVMEANKDRYPILEQTYNILVNNSEQINSDIKQVEEDLAKLKATVDNGGDDAQQEMSGIDETVDMVADEVEEATETNEIAEEETNEIADIESNVLGEGSENNEEVAVEEENSENNAIVVEDEAESNNENVVNAENGELELNDGENPVLQDQISFDDIQEEVANTVNENEEEVEVKFDDETDSNENK